MSYAEQIVIGYDWHSPLITVKSNGAVVDLTGYQLTAEFFWRGRNSNEKLANVLLTVVSGDSYLTISSPATLGKFQFDLTADQTTLFDLDPQQLPGPQQALACRVTRTDSGRKEWLADLKIQTRY